MRTFVLAVPFTLLALPLSAQRLLSSHSLPSGPYVNVLRAAGDTNGDGEQDFVAVTRESLPTGTALTVLIGSGETGQPLFTLPQAGLVQDEDAYGLGDVNGDGRSDVLLVTSGMLRVLSGSSGQVVAQLSAAVGGFGFRGTCAVGDYNGNGTGDVAVAFHNSGTSTVRILRGENLSTITGLTSYTVPDYQLTLRPMGDLTGDGRVDYACARSAGATEVVNGATGAVLWSVNPNGSDGGRVIDTLDVNGDGKLELFLIRQGHAGPGFDASYTVYDGATGNERFTRLGPADGGLGSAIAGLGDLDQDGVQDFAQTISYYEPPSHVAAISGTGLRRLWALPTWTASGTLRQVAAVGDVDDDGHGDLVVVREASSGSIWHVISGKVLAESQPQTGACGAGPFFPQLGATRPILGQTLTIAGQNGPAGAGGVLVLSLQPPGPTWLGASSCTAFFDLGAGFALAPLATPSWSIPLPLPLVPQLAGFEIALQAFWSPTAGPLGYDLSNGVWARLGYQ